jgi:guanylate kinase
MQGDRTTQRPSSGILFVVSAPSGAGKTTLCQAVRSHFPELRYSVSHTTRPPRPGEQNGVDYFFVTPEEFKSGIARGDWAEWAEVHGHYYGTAAGFVIRELASGHGILLDIDVQGARQIVKRFPDSVTIFIMPPSLEVLQERLTARAADSADVIARRLKNAVQEIAQKTFYQHVIVNDDLAEAKAELIALIGGFKTMTGWGRA